jgi:hypothetical protein
MYEKISVYTVGLLHEKINLMRDFVWTLQKAAISVERQREYDDAMMTLCIMYFDMEGSKTKNGPAQPIFLGPRAREIATELARGVVYDPFTNRCSMEPPERKWRLGGIYSDGLNED